MAKEHVKDAQITISAFHQVQCPHLKLMLIQMAKAALEKAEREQYESTQTDKQP